MKPYPKSGLGFAKQSVRRDPVSRNAACKEIDMRRTLALLALLALVLGPAMAEGDGQALYEKKCGMCHGQDGVAKKMAAGSADLNDQEWQKTATVEGLTKSIAEGKGKMKPFQEKLSPEEINLIAEYVKTLK
jgi:mono/diheme cytochrome c family protein